MGKFCPCTKNIEPNKYFFYVLILDLVLGCGLNVLAIIGLIIYYWNGKQIKIGYFNFYAKFKKIGCISCMIIFFLIILLLFFGDDGDLNIFDDIALGAGKVLVLFFIVIISPLFLWSIFIANQLLMDLEILKFPSMQNKMLESDPIYDSWVNNW